MPLRASVLTRALAGLGSGAEMRIYSSVRFGTLASFHLVDDRQYRDPQACTRDGKPGSSTVNPARVRRVAGPEAHAARRGAGALARRRVRAREQGLERARPADAVRAARFPVRSGPDVLERRLGRLPRRPRPDDRVDAQARARQSGAARRRRAPELGGPREGRLRGSRRVPRSAWNSAGPASPRDPTTAAGSTIGWRENPHFVFADAERRGYGVVEFTPKRLTTSLRVVDDVTRRDTAIETLAKFSVEAGRPVLERA